MTSRKIKLSRRGFMGSVSAAGAAGAILAAGSHTGALAQQKNAETKTPVTLPSHYYIKNALLETGFERENGMVVATKTELKTLHIKDGKIAEILDEKAALNKTTPVFDAVNTLLLPAMEDFHIHLDKTFYGGKWRAVRPNPNGIADRIAEEQKILPQLLPTAEGRTEKIIELLQRKGSVFARSHCNIEPTSKLESLEHLMNALSRHKIDFGCEIVAFPQHGLLRSNSEQLMRDAMKNGANIVGGLDPTSIDGDMEKSLTTMVQIAVDSNAGIDIHLHESGESGQKAIVRLIELCEEAKLQNKMTISHAFALAFMDEGQLKEVIERLAKNNISIASSVPVGNLHMPIPQLLEKGVKVGVGTDSVIDHWSPFGTCDNLEKAKIAAQLYGWKTEDTLGQALQIATNGITPLNAKGEPVWPKAGAEADIMFVPASCSAEAVARTPERNAVLRKGILIAGNLEKI